jgi:glucoamylase
VIAVVLIFMLAVDLLLANRLDEQRRVPLLALGIAVDPLGETALVNDGDLLAPGTRVIGGTGARSQREALRQLDWLGQGSIPHPPGFSDSGLVRDSLLDVYMLTRDYGVPLAGWNGQWRYVWPRDSAFVVSALARTHHLREAGTTMAFLQRVQGSDGLFQARYLPDRSGRVPDDRGIELDGSGWALWALREVVSQIPLNDRANFMQGFLPLLTRSSDAIVRSLNPLTGLPAPSADYWEVRETKVTLATCAVLLGGLQSAAWLYSAIGNPVRSQAIAVIAQRLEKAIVKEFESNGYPRHPGGTASDVDLGVTFLQKPFADFPSDVARRVWAASPSKMARPAGGLAPGGSWRNDGISWTPTVVTYAMAAACQRPSEALRWLEWLQAHRTKTGALPEKVLANGSAASVAPLAWSAAGVAIVADELQRGCP